MTHYSQQQCETVKWSCVELCDHLNLEWLSLKCCVWGNALWTTCCKRRRSFTTFSVSAQPNTRNKPSPISCLLLSPLNIKTGVRDWPAALQHLIPNIFTLLSPCENPNFYYYIVWFVNCMPISPMLNIFPGVLERLFSVTTFSRILRNIVTVFWAILWGMSKDRPLALRQLNLGTSENEIQLVLTRSFRFIIEIMWNCHSCSKSVRSCTNSLSVWAKPAALRFVCFYHKRVSNRVACIESCREGGKTFFCTCTFLLV